MSAQYRDRVRVTFGVLGPVAAWDERGTPIPLKGPRHRAVLARLIAANGRAVPVAGLVSDLWVAPPAGATSAVRTFVAALRRAIEPGRPPRSPATLLVTDGLGYALRTAPGDVDAWRFEAAARDANPDVLPEALSWWRGPAYADFPDDPWARGARSRLTELRLQAVERLAEARIHAGRPADAIPDLDAHVTDHPWRENAWHLLALALYRANRQADALAVLRRARRLAGQLGLDPTPALRRLESDILHQVPPDGPADILRQVPPHGPAGVWAEAAADYDRIVAATSRARLDVTVTLLRSLAVSGGLAEARRHRTVTIAAAEELGDSELTARVIGAYDVPAIWTRSDDPAQAAMVVAAARRALARDPGPATRARLLATVAMESRGADSTPSTRAGAEEAVRLARERDDPALLAFALNALFLQTTYRPGLAGERDGIGAELIGLAAAPTSEVLGHLIRMQALGARNDFDAAGRHAEAADTLAARHDLPLVAVFTDWFRAMRLSLTDPVAAGHAYRRAAALLHGTGMPGLEKGLLDLALLTLRLRRGRPAQDGDYGPYQPWVRPLLLLSTGDNAGARRALRAAPDPPGDLLTEAMWCLLAHAARAVGDAASLARARDALRSAAGENAGAGSGLLTLGDVADFIGRFPDRGREASNKR